MTAIELNNPGLAPGWFLSQGDHSARSTADSATDLPEVESVPKRVLVIDDEIAIADSLTEILNVSGYDAFAFYNGDDAIEFARRHCPDLVISDVIMPKLNGVDTVLSIRKLCPATRILLFSGQAGTAEILQKAHAKGHQFELLPKPIHPDALLKKLSS